jgi:dihydroneopterin aldolase
MSGDRLRIRGLQVETVIGVGDDERRQAQTVSIDLDVSFDMDEAATTDELAATVDYAGLIAAIEALAGRGERLLLERLAGEVAELVLGYRGVSTVTVEIGKVTVPVPQEVGSVSVRITRGM